MVKVGPDKSRDEVMIDGLCYDMKDNVLSFDSPRIYVLVMRTRVSVLEKEAYVNVQCYCFA